MKTIQAFITAGWYTVPLRGELKRLENGKKTLPIFEEGWKTKYHNKFNNKATALGGALSGEKSGFVAVDCDNDITWELFHMLDPEHDFVFVSKGKGKTAGTFIYEYDQDFADSFSIADGTLALDFYSNNGFVYLPTEANETKEVMTKVPAIKPIPAPTRVLLSNLLKTKSRAVEDTRTVNTFNAVCLRPIIEQFLITKKFMPGLFKIITPKSFRDTDQYILEGFLHPANVPEGRGSEYLSKLSAIFGADISIDAEVYVKAMVAVNDLFTEPMAADRFEATILNPMVEGRAAIDGKHIWQYDESWAEHKLIINTKRQTVCELGYDDFRQLYYLVDTANSKIAKFSSPDDLTNHVKSVANSAPSKAELLANVPLINVVTDASKEFGFDIDSDPTVRTLNTFVRTPELAILQNPESYARFYNKPETMLAYLRTLIPDEATRSYALRFLKRKLTRFEYSPVVLYFLGISGSGKDTFVEILETIMGNIAKPTTKEFLEIYNTYMLDTYFVQLDEYGNQLTKVSDKEEVQGKLKAYTGKPVITIRRMRNEGFSYKHNVTFISTANKQPLLLEDNDRRILFINTPNKLADAPWVSNIADTRDKIMAEIKDFCYYLATEVEELSKNEYMVPLDSEEKHRMIADSMFASSRLVYAFKHGMFNYVRDLAVSYGCERFIRAMDSGRIFVDDMEELYEALTDYQGDMRTLNKHMRNSGVDLVATTKDGVKAYYYKLDLNPFSEIDGDFND